MPNAVDLRLELVNALYRNEDLEGATAACDKAIGLEPENANAHNLKGKVLESLTRVDDALRFWQEYHFD